MSYYRLYKQNREQFKACLFFFCLVLFLLVSAAYGVSSIENVILGTELNGDGTIEYLCLGNSCEDYLKMNW